MESQMIRAVVQVPLFFLPWPLRRRLLCMLFNYRLAESSKIGISIVCATSVQMERGSRIGHFTIVKGLRRVLMEECASIGNLNWITGLLDRTSFFKDNEERSSTLIVKKHAAITNRHFIDCSDLVSIGEFSVLGGWGSQILTHGIDIRASAQRASPVFIGAYCFVGTRAVLLKGSKLPDFCVLAAGSTLHKPETERFWLYSGVPAKAVRQLDPECAYFHRREGFVA